MIMTMNVTCNNIKDVTDISKIIFLIILLYIYLYIFSFHVDHTEIMFASILSESRMQWINTENHWPGSGLIQELVQKCVNCKNAVEQWKTQINHDTKY